MRAETQQACIDWFKPILEAVNGGWVAGGALRDYFAKSANYSDIDVFFINEDAYNQARKKLKQLNAFKVMYSHKTLAAFKWRTKTIQLIGTHFFQDPAETISNFDFTVCCAAVDLQKVYHHEHFFEDLACKRLAINSLPFPLATLERLQKYAKKGYTACNGTLLTLTKAISQVDLEDKKNTLAFYADGTERFIRFD